MKIDYECIRDVMLYLEDNLTINKDFSFGCLTSEQIISDLKNSELYTEQDVYYSIYNLSECGYIETTEIPYGNTILFSVYNISYAGHEFISSIRHPKVWNYLKEKLSEVKIENIPTILKIVNTIISTINL
jgi:hypothetical protein